MQVIEQDGKYVVGPYETREQAQQHVDAMQIAADHDNENRFDETPEEKPVHHKLGIEERFTNLLRTLSGHGIHAEPTEGDGEGDGSVVKVPETKSEPASDLSDVPKANDEPALAAEEAK